MQPQSLLAFLSALALTSAGPIKRKCGSATVPASVNYVLPSAGEASPLPSPPSNMTLKHIALGHGIQNYTCTGAGAEATSFGALATLYDITALYPGSGADALSDADFAGLPPKALQTTPEPLNMQSPDDVGLGADLADPFPASAPLTLDGVSGELGVLGHHFFDGANVPTFDLSGVSDQTQRFAGAKQGTATAPADAYPGLDDEGAVAWLALGDAGGSQNIGYVYRVYTAGGSPAVCADAGDAPSVAYAAQYWFYG
ncbi:hypothetical protein F4780DRAFT_781092 [Xylariomycetidae sp. FL0641]|nr:hypothetical protein F4780DRAFT_781092 [Xylariomycetidae sp. FL0641]